MSCLERGETSCEIQAAWYKPQLVADILEPSGGDSFELLISTRLTGTTQGSPTQSEGNAVHEAEQGQKEDTQQGRSAWFSAQERPTRTRHESWAGIVLLWVGLVSLWPAVGGASGAYLIVAKR